MRLNLEKCRHLLTDEFLEWLGPNPALVDKNGIPVPCYRVENAAHVGTSMSGGLVCYGISPYTTYKYLPSPARLFDGYRTVEQGGKYGRGARRYGRGTQGARDGQEARYLRDLEQRHVFGSLSLQQDDVQQAERGRTWSPINPSAAFCTSFVFLRAMRIARLGSDLVQNTKTGAFRFTSKKRPEELLVMPTGYFANTSTSSVVVKRSGHDSVLYTAQGDFVVAALNTVGSYSVYKALRPGVSLKCGDISQTMTRIQNDASAEPDFDINFDDIDFS